MRNWPVFAVLISVLVVVRFGAGAEFKLEKGDHICLVGNALGERLEAGDLKRREGLGPQRHLAVICGRAHDLGIGFTRSAGLATIRENVKQIEARWVS